MSWSRPARPGRWLAVYGATKAFDLLLIESLWSEPAPSGLVDVLATVLGQTDTPALRRLLGDREIAGLADPVDVARRDFEQPGPPTHVAA